MPLVKLLVEGHGHVLGSWRLSIRAVWVGPDDIAVTELTSCWITVLETKLGPIPLLPVSLLHALRIDCATLQLPLAKLVVASPAQAGMLWGRRAREVIKLVVRLPCEPLSLAQILHALWVELRHLLLERQRGIEAVVQLLNLPAVLVGRGNSRPCRWKPLLLAVGFVLGEVVQVDVLGLGWLASHPLDVDPAFEKLDSGIVGAGDLLGPHPERS